MNGKQTETGYFLFSLDTELAWGHFDCFQPHMFSGDGRKERESVEKILDVLDEFNIIGTWAFVGHLFFDQCEACEVCPILDWQGKYPTFEKIYKTNQPLWYGADVLESVLSRKISHEIAFHGYTHKTFDESSMTREEAATEIQEWLRMSKRKNIVPQSVIFPRNKIGHLDLFKQSGFICYRGEELMPSMYSLPLIGRVFRRGYYYLSALATPPVYKYQPGASGLVNFPSSRWLFGFNRNVERVLDALNLHKFRIDKMIRGVKKAALENKIIHIWAHPYEFKNEKDIEKLRYLLKHVSEQVSAERMQSVGMAELAQKVTSQHQYVVTA